MIDDKVVVDVRFDNLTHSLLANKKITQELVVIKLLHRML